MIKGGEWENTANEKLGGSESRIETNQSQVRTRREGSSEGAAGSGNKSHQNGAKRVRKIRNGALLGFKGF